VFFWFFSEFKILFFGVFKIENLKKTNFEVTSNMFLKTGNPKESARKDKTTFSLRKKALKKTL